MKSTIIFIILFTMKNRNIVLSIILILGGCAIQKISYEQEQFDFAFL